MIAGEHRKDNLTLPKGFKELVSQISLPANIILIDKRQRKWPVIVEAAGVLGRQVAITCGWTNFCTESLLSEWEMLVFERVDLYAWQVTLYNYDYIEREVVRQRTRHLAAPNVCRSFAGIHMGPTESGEGTWSDRVWLVRIKFGVSGDTLSVSVFIAQGMRRRVLPDVNVKNNPKMKFQKLMKKHSINILDIPIEWVKTTGLELPIELFMMNGNGRRWCVGVEGRRNNYGKCYRFEPQGWRAFYVENGLRLGDSVEFEYIGGSGNLLNVTATSAT
ncbi:hypothetical protein C2S51_015081 [Perilla frutescens var. frutescens]|nr:hypothetical protein C2S51_015081 [Perilla frutescens var. frutescens]